MAIKFETGPDVQLLKPSLDKATAPYGGEPRYHSGFMIPKNDTKTVQAVRDAVKKATEDAVKSIWNGQRPARLNDPLKDGDTKGFDYMKGYLIVDAKTKNLPRLFHLDGTQASPDEFQSGATVQAELSIFAYNHKGLSMGLGAGIERIWLVKSSDLQDDDDNVAPVQAERNKADSDDWSFLN